MFCITCNVLNLQGLSLVSSLSAVGEWNDLFSELMQHKKLKMKIAASLYTGSPAVKCQVLKLISYLSNDNRYFFSSFLLINMKNLTFDNVLQQIIYIN